MPDGSKKREQKKVDFPTSTVEFLFLSIKVTASYQTPEMSALAEDAKAAGITIVNEVNLLLLLLRILFNSTAPNVDKT